MKRFRTTYGNPCLTASRRQGTRLITAVDLLNNKLLSGSGFQVFLPDSCLSVIWGWFWINQDPWSVSCSEGWSSLVVLVKSIRKVFGHPHIMLPETRAIKDINTDHVSRDYMVRLVWFVSVWLLSHEPYNKKTAPEMKRFRTTYGNRTRDSSVKGRRLNPLTNAASC